MGRTFSTWLYEDDQGNLYNRKAAGDYVAQLDDATVKVGGLAATAWHAQMPKSFKPRTAVCEDSGGTRYRVVCYAPDALLYVTLGMTFNIFDRDGGSAVSVTNIGSEGERKRHSTLV